MLKIPSYSKYLIDEKGNVFSTISNKFLKSHIQPTGYPAFTLIHDTKGKTTVPTHRLLATTYISNPENKREVNHIDGVKTNNGLHNLEWVHGYENIRHAFKTNLAKASSAMDYSKIAAIVQELRQNPDSSWASIAINYGYKDSSALRKLIKRDFIRQGNEHEFDKLCDLVRLRRGINHSKLQKGKPAHNRKQVKVIGGATYESLAATARALGFTSSKGSVAIKMGKPIKGYYLEYA